LVISNADVFNREGVYGSWFTLRRSSKSVLFNTVRFSFLGCCFLLKRDVFEKSSPFPWAHTLVTHDHWLFVNAVIYSKVKILDDSLMKYRRHSNNASKGTDSLIGFKNQILYRLRLIHFLYANFIYRRRASKKLRLGGYKKKDKSTS
jgi:hypothetical protein